MRKILGNSLKPISISSTEKSNPSAKRARALGPKQKKLVEFITQHRSPTPDSKMKLSVTLAPAAETVLQMQSMGAETFAKLLLKCASDCMKSKSESPSKLEIKGIAEYAFPQYNYQASERDDQNGRFHNLLNYALGQRTHLHEDPRLAHEESASR